MHVCNRVSHKFQLSFVHLQKISYPYRQGTQDTYLSFYNNINHCCKRLVAVRKTAHTAHDAQDVVVDCIYANIPRIIRIRIYTSSAAHVENNRGRINSREVARARRLVLFGPQGKRVHVDVGLFGCICRNCVSEASMVLRLLRFVKVVTIALIQTILAVELQPLLDRKSVV